MADNITEKLTPQEFFETIGNKVQNFAPGANGAEEEEDDQRAVEEIESLCMNCGKNVWNHHNAELYGSTANLISRE